LDRHAAKNHSSIAGRLKLVRADRGKGQRGGFLGRDRAHILSTHGCAICQ
jgi:hypothetical protein